jgi:hypothetical protein
MEASARDKAGTRFYPGFHGGGFIGLTDRPFLGPQGADRRGMDYEFDSFDPFDPLDAGMQIGINSWIRRVIYLQNTELYNSGSLNKDFFGNF